MLLLLRTCIQPLVGELRDYKPSVQKTNKATKTLPKIWFQGLCSHRQVTELDSITVYSVVNWRALYLLDVIFVKLMRYCALKQCEENFGSNTYM